MEVRIFQILVPLLVLIYVGYQIRLVFNSTKGWLDIAPIIVLSSILLVIAVAPDWISNKLAGLLGFKSNVNAILFSLIGIICLFVFKIFDSIKTLQRNITKLSIEYALLEEKIKSKE